MFFRSVPDVTEEVVDRLMNGAVERVMQAGASYQGKQLPDYTPGISAQAVAEAGGVTRPLELLFLGSGNGFSPAGRYWNSFLANERYLFDCCPVALPHLKVRGVSLDGIDAVVISHFHADHFFGLPFLLLEYGYVRQRDRELTIIGPPGIEERTRSLSTAAFPGIFEKPIAQQLDFREVDDGDEIEVAGLRLQARAVDHVEDFVCLGFRAEIGGRTLAYSGDTKVCDALLDLAAGADVAVLECSAWSCEVAGPHMCPDDIRELRGRLGPNPAFVLTHLAQGEQDLRIENTQLARDLAVYTF